MEKLPKSFIKQGFVQIAIEQLEKQIEGVNKAIKVFQQEDLPTDLEFLQAHTKTQGEFAKWVGSQEEAYTRSLGFLPKKERERIHQSFEELVTRVENERNTIGVFLSGVTYPILQKKDNSFDYDWKKVREDIEEKNTYTYTDEDKEYFQILSLAQEAIQQIAVWEEKHTYTPIARIVGNVGELLAGSFSVDWFQKNIGWKIGKSNATVLKMIREQEDD